jgi:GTPase Era involved in 16S rRNA processing
VGDFRAGFACFVGRPNAGKSTLTNAIIGQKIAITSTRPQTTRHVIRGVLHRPDAQLVLVDTPGLHRPRTLLGQRLNDLVEVLCRHLPESPQLYPDDMLTDEPEQVLIAELIREAALEGVRDELPHSIAVLVEEVLVEGDLTKIYADVYVERTSQKAIVIGAGGSRLKQVGTQARRSIEELLGTRVYLDLHVRVAKDWQRDPKQLRKLGF